MPQDPNLYGQRPPKRQRKEMDLSDTLSFASQVTALLADSGTASGPARARPRPSRSAPDAFAGVKAKKNKMHGVGEGVEGEDGGKKKKAKAGLNLRDPLGTEDDKAERARTRRNMEEKARRYAAMKRGDYVAREGEEGPLIDFDRKWAETRGGSGGGGGGGGRRGAAAESSSGSDNESSDGDGEEQDNNDTELVEFEDEFGRLRRVTAAEKMRMERRLARGETAASELERMSARPRAPDNIIFGDAVQAEAFAATDAERMEELARRRDRSATPPEATHYDASREIRSKGVGFYAFSKDSDTRAKEMAALEEERARTEALRKAREDKLTARKREIEARRKEIGEKRAKKMADSFLDGLGKDMADGGAAEKSDEKDGAGSAASP